MRACESILNRTWVWALSDPTRSRSPSIIQHDRQDINKEIVPVLYEKFIKVKAGLDFALSLTILAGAY